MNLVIESQRDNIERAFKSLIKCGRPDIKDEENNDLVPSLYVDLFENEYILKQALDETHVIFKGRKGTGKSTVFLKAERDLKQKKNIIPIYINLQSCYEEIRTSDIELQEKLNQYGVYKKFFDEVLKKIKEACCGWIKDKQIEELFDEIEKGQYIDVNFQRTMQMTTAHQGSVTANLSKASQDVSLQASGKTEKQFETTEMRIFSINAILTKLKQILQKHSIIKVYLFLDDFSELSKESQTLMVDSLIAPIIASYNDMFVIKLAAYPYRIYLGKIDSSKIVPYSLDFYDVYEKTSTNYTMVEASSIDYVKRTICKRIEVYTQGQIEADDLFDTTKTSIETYYKTLFYASAGIPRCLGYILTYCFISSINSGNQITLQNINTAAKKYYNDNVLAEFYNDSRYKQSFFDDDKILTQLTQKRLMDDLIKLSKSIKRTYVESFTAEKNIKEIFKNTLNKMKIGATYVMPTSHFYVEKEIESILQTLELYYIVSKFNEGSSRKPGKKVSFYGLNYGLCLENGIDYGKPEFRRAYDYWRQEEFDYTDFIPAALNTVKVPKCKKCGYEYTDKTEYEIVKKFGYCLKCKTDGEIDEVNELEDAVQEQIKKWKEVQLPDIEIEILRVLYNNRERKLTAHEVGGEVEKHHLGVTKIMEKLKRQGYVDFELRGVRHYFIEQKAINTFFAE
ncbi:MAG: hypothetical protein GX217_04755 [Clostridiaceae bacterium]|nr:hypothetical protein [Clostridiaceae bacterium]